MGFCGVPGLRNSSFRSFPIALRLDGHHGSSSAELPVRFRGDTINIHAWSRGSRDPRDLAVEFLAAPLTGAQNYLLEYIACNIYIYMYIYVCICEYMYMCIYVCICIYANNLNDPRHSFVIGPSSLFCMDVYDHIINVFPVHSLNKRFLILILIPILIHDWHMSTIHDTWEIFIPVSWWLDRPLVDLSMESGIITIFPSIFIFASENTWAQ